MISWYKHLKLKGIRVGLFCEDYPALRDRQLSKIKMEFPDWLGSYKEATHEFTLNPAFGNGVICFRNLDNPSKYLSSEFAAIAIDELTLNEQTVFDFLRMRLRWVGVEDPKLIAGRIPAVRVICGSETYSLTEIFRRKCGISQIKLLLYRHGLMIIHTCQRDTVTRLIRCRINLEKRIAKATGIYSRAGL